MPQIQLTDQIFDAARRRAADGGFSSVDEYIADVLVHDLGEDTDNFDRLFTPERTGHLEKISAEIKAGGKTYTVQEVEKHFENKRKVWLTNEQARG
jgi:hypothetical protein